MIRRAACLCLPAILISTQLSAQTQPATAPATLPALTEAQARALVDAHTVLSDDQKIKLFYHPSITSNGDKPTLDRMFTFRLSPNIPGKNLLNDTSDWNGQTVFLSDPKLLHALGDNGTDFATNRFSHIYTSVNSPLLDFSAQTDTPDRRITHIEFTVNIRGITEWQTLTFDKLTRDKSPQLHCGPFELITSGDDNQFNVTAGAMAENEQEHRAYREKIPLDFITHAYAVHMLEITDAAGEPLNSNGGISTGGMSSCNFSKTTITMIPATTAPATTPTTPTTPTTLGTNNTISNAQTKPIAYPVTITLRLPAKWDTQTSTFKFDLKP